MSRSGSSTTRPTLQNHILPSPQKMFTTASDTLSFGVPETRRFARQRRQARQKRAHLFWQLMQPKPTDTILDLGGGHGRHLADILPNHDPRRITVADTNRKKLAQCAFNTVLLDERSHRLPFGFGEFDIVFCSSVIEHVTVPRSEVWTCPAKEFRRRSEQAQLDFAQEIARVGKRFFVQTPYLYFPIEAHSLLPAPVFFLPRRAQLAVLKVTRTVWLRRTPDYLLFDYERLQAIFPSAKIVAERWLGLTKSLVAARG